MAKIMLALQNERNRELIRDELAENHSALEGREEEDCARDVDLVIFDLPTFKKLREACESKREEEKPLHLPVLLLLEREKEEAVAKYLGDTVDDILLTPVKKPELKTRIGSLLQTRRFSLKFRDQMREESLKDPLTGLYNRRYFQEFIEKEAERARRYGHPISFSMMDINNFKDINDRYSHMVGDEVLKDISQLLLDNIRESDILVRYGGDEFLLVMPETNRGITVVVDRIVHKLKEWNGKTDLIEETLEIAIGQSYWAPEKDISIEQALKEADEDMYENKRG
ncbi:MAG: GGDEF domain-containing protein [Candidatus Bipolaricaulia bacterium]